MQLDTLVSSGEFFASLLKLFPTNLIKSVVGISLEELLTLTSDKLKDEAIKAKNRKKSIKSVIFLMLQKLEYAKETGNIYYYKELQVDDESN